jgi:hypothetical protein
MGKPTIASLNIQGAYRLLSFANIFTYKECKKAIL